MWLSPRDALSGVCVRRSYVCGCFNEIVEFDTRAGLYEYFSTFGEVVVFDVPAKWFKSRKPDGGEWFGYRGYGFVQYRTKEELVRAMEGTDREALGPFGTRKLTLERSTKEFDVGRMWEFVGGDLAQSVDGPKVCPYAADAPVVFGNYDGYDNPPDMWEVNRGKPFMDEVRKRRLERPVFDGASAKEGDYNTFYTDSGSEDDQTLYSRSEVRGGRRTPVGAEIDNMSIRSVAAGSEVPSEVVNFRR